MIHRGPDDAGVWWSEDGCVGLAHSRLAIVDLSPAGHQPMMDATGNLCIVSNGEIYNFKELRQKLEAKGHSFRSSSDTEVILAAYREWDTECLVRLNGMFAFGLYDSVQRRLFLARDRAGEKPLFYRETKDGLSFASELKALMADPSLDRRIDPESLDCYLAFGYVPGHRCILRGVEKLPLAHALAYDLEKRTARVRRYWQLPPSPEETDVSINRPEEELLQELDSLLEDSVKKQLVADVPVGILLSGGVDSSLVTAMAVRSISRVKTFTIRFPGYSKYDETEHARLIAQNFGTEHVELEAEPSTVGLLPMLAQQFDEPMVDSSMIPTYLVSKLARRHCTVALGGDGGDELFGGYGYYGRLLWLKNWSEWIPRFLRRGIAAMSQTVLPLGFKGRNLLQELGTDFQAGLPSISTYFDLSARHQLLNHLWQDERHDVFSAEVIRKERIPNHPDLLQRATAWILKTISPKTSW